ncbi:MAG TPA: hypothetical protein VKW76_07200 [Candidatus Binatia bacterium]|nr:hypothetical protein [Candidatus Binatia bacterium]
MARLIGITLLLAVGAEGAVAPELDGPIRFAAPPPRVWRVRAPAAALGTRALTARAPRTVATFSDVFSYGGQVYPYTMVGRNPRLSQGTTVVPAVIVPVRFVFADGRKLDPGKTTRQLRRSPLFRRSTFASGTTQYGDAVQRAEFWTVTQATGYHVLLGRPTVTGTVVVKVPAGAGLTGTSRFGGLAGIVAERFLSQEVVPMVVNRLRLPPSKLVVLWSYDVVLAPPSGTGVIFGEHSSGHDQALTRTWTWVWASWHTPGTAPQSAQDVAALSHEIAEWYNDPFAANVVPAWDAPPAYPCNDALEVGDPLVGTAFVQDGYHLQDEAFLSWFAREVPSAGIDGRYSLLGTLTAPPAVCPLP